MGSVHKTITQKRALSQKGIGYRKKIGIYTLVKLNRVPKTRFRCLLSPEDIIKRSAPYWADPLLVLTVLYVYKD